MNKRLWIWISVILAVFALAITALELSSELDYKKSILSARLEGYADVVASSQDYGGAVRLLPEDIRVSVVSPSGEVVYDSYEGEVLGSHLDRPEIQACLSGSEGCSIRRSGTSGIEYIYFAKRYGDVIVRTAMPFELAQKRFMHPDWTLLITIGLLFLLAALLTRRLSLRADAKAKEAADEQLKTQKKRITGNLAHELRTPVTSIRGYLETLVDNPQMDEAKKGQFIDRAYRQTLRLSDLIRDISLITKMEEAPQTLKKEHLGMRHLTCEVIEEFAGTIAAQGVKVENTIADDVCILAISRCSMRCCATWWRIRSDTQGMGLQSIWSVPFTRELRTFSITIPARASVMSTWGRFSSVSTASLRRIPTAPRVPALVCPL